MKKIIKATSVLGVSSLVRVFSGLVRAKFLAWQLGPLGLGVTGQATMYSISTTQLCSLNMGMGMIKDISEKVSRKDEEGARFIVDIAANMQLMMSLAFIAVVLPFSWWISKALFTDTRYWLYFVGITLVTPFAVYPVAFASPVFYGFRKIPEYTAAMIIYTLAGLALLVGLVWFYKIDGMFIQIIVLSLAGFLIFYHAMKRALSVFAKPDFAIFRNKAARTASVRLFKFSLISFIPGTVNVMVILYLRGILMRQYGIEANGYFQVAYALSSYYLPFVTNGIWGHFYPEMCSLQAEDSINRELNRFMRFTLITSTAIAAGCVIFRKYIINILFSGEFMKAYDLLAIQAIVDIFFVIFSMFSTSLMARRKFTGVVLVSTATYNLVLILSYFLFASFFHFDFRSLNLAIALTNIIVVGVFVVYAHNETGFIVSKANLVFFAKSAVFMAVILLIPDKNVIMTIAKVAVAFAWLFVSLTKEELKSAHGLVVSFAAGKGDSR